MTASSSPTLPKGAQVLRPNTTQTAAFTASSVAISNAVASSVVRLHATEDCFVTFATTPTATTSHMFLPADTTEYFRCEPGEKVAAIRSSISGTLYVTEVD